jgi:hypothetical protein
MITGTETDTFRRIEELYPECHAETKAIDHDKDAGGPLSPQLKSVHHLSHEGSKMVTGPLALFAEWALARWLVLKHWWQRLMKRLYPRRNVIYGTLDDSSLVGRLTFSQREDGHVPLHHMHLEFWGRTRLGKWKKFSYGSTAEDGTFELPFEMMAVRAYNVRKLWFEIYHTGQFIYEDGKAKPHFELFHKIPVKKKDLTGMSYDLGMIQLHYWEYRNDSPVPRTVVKDHEKYPPERYAPGRVEAIEKQFIPIELTTKKHLRKISTGPEHLSIEKIQEDYPENLTVCMEHEEPGITRSDEWFGMRFMNGMFASTFDRDPEDPLLYWVYYHWRTYDHDPSVYAIPDVSIKFRMHSSGYLLPAQIGLHGRLRPDGDLREKTTLTPTDGQRWQAAKRVARVSAAIATEIDRHFAETHTNVEQYALAVRRNIRRNPIGAILFPHVKEVSLINHTADQILISADGYIAKATALKSSGLLKRVYDVMGTLDWKNWRPMDPISEKHTYARVSHLFFDIVQKFVAEFIADHRDEIIDEWHEIYTMSEDLVSHSVPMFMCDYLKRKLHPDEEGRVADTEANAWYARDNRMDMTISRPHFSVGEAIDKRLQEDDIKDHKSDEEDSHIVKALSRLTSNKDYDPSSDDMEQLGQLCSYVIFQATFGHYWSNSKQYDDIGEIRYNSLGIRLGTPEHGVFGPEDDDAIAPDLRISTQMMWWSNMLSRTGYGFLTKNEEQDIHPRLVEMLKERRDDFAELDIDVDDIQSRTNI